MSDTPDRPRGAMARFLGLIERVGNLLPHPSTLFLILALLVVFLSEVATWFELSAIHPGKKNPDGSDLVIEPVSLMTVDGLHLILTNRRIRNLIFVGLTTDVCVHSSLRSAIDRGYDCMVLEDCTAATVEANYRAALDTITTEGGYFGTVSDSAALLAAL